MKLAVVRKVLLVIALAVWLSSCVDLKAVHKYASSSLKGVSKYQEIGYTFTSHCLDRCSYELVRKASIQREPKCSDCKLYRKADAATNTIYKHIRNYFDALDNLSNNELTSYKMDDLSNALQEGEFGGIEITKADANAATKIGEILLRASTDIYRKNKIEEFVGQANADLQILLLKFQDIIGANLAGEIDFKKEMIYAYYNEIVRDSLNSQYVKSQAAYQYYEEWEALNKKQAQIKSYARSLGRIAKGHQKIYDNRDKMNQREFKTLISGYAGDIRDIISEFNKLKE